MFLGPRVIKTGISVTLALFICSILNLEPAVFAGVAAIFTIQPSIYKTWKQVLDQISTNTLGAAIALFAVYYLGNHPITIGFVMIIVIVLSLRLKMESTISLTLVTVLAIMSAPGNQDWWFALNRFSIILIGIGSAFLVNIFIFPPKYKNQYLTKSKSVFENLSLLLRTAVSNEMTEKSYQEHSTTLKADLAKLEELYKIFDEERAKMSKVNPVDVREIVVFKQMLKSLTQGVQVLEVIEEHYFSSNTNHLEDEYFDEHLEHLIKCHELFLLKFEGKIKIEEEYPEEAVLTDSGLLLEKVMRKYSEEQQQRLRMVVIGSSIFEYAFQLNRLNLVVEQYLKKAKLNKK